jgi:hypothetical protein
MDPEQQEQRIADLEKRLVFLERCNQEHGLFSVAVTSVLASMGDQTVEKDHSMLKMMVDAQANNEGFFRIFGRLLPDEDTRKQLETILNHSTVTRDQIEAVLEQMKERPKPSSVLKKLGLPPTDPPAAPTQPPPA